MKAFAYVAPDSVDGAVDQLVDHPDGSLPLAGGMDLLGLMKDFVIEPDLLVALGGVDGLHAIEETDTGLRIGAMVTLAEIAADERIRSTWPALAAAAESVGTPQIRNRGTIGGNLCQRPRCWYFRSEFYGCLRKGGAACFAVDGDNRYHAIFDTAPCPIVHPSNTAIALRAFGARVTVAGPGPASGDASLETMDIADFFVRPAQDIRRENILDGDEIVVAIDLPTTSARSATYTIKHKQSHDWPLAMASVVLDMSGETVDAAHIVMGAVAPIPWRAEAAERSLTGQAVTIANAEAAADAAVADADPLEHNAYKVRLARTAVKRAILEAAGVDWATG